jgi:hypothetical protein
VQLIAALWATINGCSASVTDRGGWCVAAPSNANRLAPLATTVNGQNREKIYLNKRVKRTCPETIE